MQDIKLSPSFTWFCLHNVMLLLLLCTSIICTFTILVTELKYLCGTVYIVSFLTLFIKYLNIVCTKWEITNTQILIYKGILFKKIDFIELYRVIDFQIKTNPILKLFNITSIVIVSQDNNTPQLILYGIKHDPLKLVNNIRQRVQQQRKENHIYEISNR